MEVWEDMAGQWAITMNQKQQTQKQDEPKPAREEKDTSLPYPVLPDDHPFYSQGPMIFFMNRPGKRTSSTPESTDIPETAQPECEVAAYGDPHLLFAMGAKYAIGEGVPEDKVEAAKWFRKAAEQGHADAQHILAVMYGTGEGVPIDNAEAVKWYRMAAEQGDAAAQNNLRLMYRDGRGVPKDDTEAVK